MIIVSTPGENIMNMLICTVYETNRVHTAAADGISKEGLVRLRCIYDLITARGAFSNDT